LRFFSSSSASLAGSTTFFGSTATAAEGAGVVEAVDDADEDAFGVMAVLAVVETEGRRGRGGAIDAFSTYG
jgi:hypothetical protein